MSQNSENHTRTTIWLSPADRERIERLHRDLADPAGRPSRSGVIRIALHHLESARIIAQHVTAGMELAERHKLPARVRDFIPEHHGTRLVAYFYRLASQKDPNVDPHFFRYPGPKPQSRETAIVMLADSTEAMVRASEDRSAERIDVIVDEVVSERLAEGELEECDLTLRDNRTIAR